MAKEVRGPVEQMLSVVVPGYGPSGRPQRTLPFADQAPGFFDYLVQERGLRPVSVTAYRHHLDRFEAYLQRIGVESVRELSPTILSGFIVEHASVGLAKSTVRDGAGVLRVFLRYAHREGVVATDLSAAVGWPQVYRLATIPRSISWEEVNRVLAGVDRRTVAGRRDYAILLLLVTYGLRGREVAALTLDDIDWKRERLAGCQSARPDIPRPSRCPRWSGRHSWTISNTAVPRRRIDTCSSGRSRRVGRSDLPRCPRWPVSTCSRPVWRFLGLARTPCVTRRCSAWSTRTWT